jgi:hypothetical protein
MWPPIWQEWGYTQQNRYANKASCGFSQVLAARIYLWCYNIGMIKNWSVSLISVLLLVPALFVWGVAIFVQEAHMPVLMQMCTQGILPILAGLLAVWTLATDKKRKKSKAIPGNGTVRGHRARELLRALGESQLDPNGGALERYMGFGILPVWKEKRSLRSRART